MLTPLPRRSLHLPVDSSYWAKQNTGSEPVAGKVSSSSGSSSSSSRACAWAGMLSTVPLQPRQGGGLALCALTCSQS